MAVAAYIFKTTDMGLVGVMLYIFGKEFETTCQYDVVNDRCVWEIPNEYQRALEIHVGWTDGTLLVEPKKFLKCMARVRHDMHNARRAASA